MAWLVVILAFVLLTAGVVAAAFGGRRHPAGRPGKARRRAVATGIGLAIVATGLGLPALILALNPDEEASATGGVRLTAAESHGREVFARNCSNCHTLAAANAVGKVGPNLDVLQPPAALVIDAVKNGRARGSGQMPRGLLTGTDLQDTAAFVARTAGR
jgi:mono/diheme cytochrome c family protein